MQATVTVAYCRQGNAVTMREMQSAAKVFHICIEPCEEVQVLKH